MFEKHCTTETLQNIDIIKKSKFMNIEYTNINIE